MKLNHQWIILSLFLTSGIIACSSAKLGNVPETRENYNIALDNSENEQFLLNVVRLHYGQSPYFVGVDSITAATSLTVGATGDLGVNNPFAPINGVQWAISPNLRFAQTPTITYSPIQGAKFASGMLAPLTLDKIYLLLQSGYNLKEVMKLTINRIGKLDNGVASQHVGARRLPDSYQFDQFINSLDNLIEQNQINSELTQYESQPAILIYANSNDSAKLLSNSLQLSKTYRKIILATTLPIDTTQPENIISVYPRSFFNVINFLAKNVDEPPAATDYESDTYNAPLVSKDVAWDKLTYNMLHIQQSYDEPKSVITKSEYEGTWYYIAENDALSKSTLVLLKLIYSLQMGEVNANLPLVTIPIN